MRRTLISFAYGIAVIALLVALWLGVKVSSRLPDFVLPWPQDIGNALVDPNSRIFFHFGTTLVEATAGFVLANIVAFVMALLFQRSEFARRLLMPVAIGLKTTPVVAIAPLLLIWFGSGFESKVLASAIVAFFPLLVGLYEAMSQTPRNLLEYFESLGASKSEVIKSLRLPYAVPEALAALKVSATLAVVGAVVGEFVGARAGLGYLILTSSYQFQTSVTFAAILMTCICGGLLFVAVLSVEKIVNIARWRS